MNVFAIMMLKIIIICVGIVSNYARVLNVILFTRSANVNVIEEV